MILLVTGTIAAQQREIFFGGIPWIVRETGERSEGPGPNLWRGDEQSVWVDEDGLHLTVREVDGEYRASEVYTRHPVPGYGTYTFTVETPAWPFGSDLVLGFFLYQHLGEQNTPQEYELDIEFSRWGWEDGPLGHYTVMYRPPGSSVSAIPSHSFELSSTYARTTHQLRWYPGEVSYRSWGIDRSGQRSTIANHVFTDERVHPIDRQRLHINFWLFQGSPPENWSEREIIIREVHLCTQ